MIAGGDASARLQPLRLLRSSDLRASLALLLGIWCVVLIGQILADLSSDALFVGCAFAVATVVAVAARPRPRGSVRVPIVSILPIVPLVTSALGLAAGFASYPAWVATIWLAGSAVGLTAEALPATTAPIETPLWIAMVLLGPIFEELLYRERLLPQLRAHVGPIPAILLSSSLFAISHVFPWSVLGCFLIGLALSSLYLASGSVALCISMHAGFNFASLSCGLPPRDFALSPIASAVVAWIATLLAVTLARRLPQTNTPPRGFASAVRGLTRARRR